MINKNTFGLTASCALGAALAGSALGQQVTSGESTFEEQPAIEQQFQFAPSYTHIFDSDFDKGGGSVAVDRIGGRGAYTLKVNENKLTIGGLYEFSNYDLDRGGNEGFQRVGADLMYQAMCTEKWGYFGYAAGQLSADTDANLSDGLLGTFAAGARYVHSPTLSVNFGLGYATSLEDDGYVLPLIAVNWQINDRWALRTLNGATVSYDLTGDKKHLLDFGVNFQRREYRLPKSSSFNVGAKDASLIDKGVNIEVGYTHNFSETIAVRGFAGVAAGRNYEVRMNDHKVGDVDVDPGMFLGVRGVIKF